jgi:hypothetical protein
VSFSEDQIGSLSVTGVNFEPVYHDVDRSEYYIVRSLCHHELHGARTSLVKEHIELSTGTYLSAMSPAEAAAIPDSSELFARNLNELNIPISYLVPAYEGLLLQIEDFPSDTLVNRVSQDSIYAFVTRLEAFQTRYIWSDSIDFARDWLVGQFQSWGYSDVTTPSFWWDGDWHYNVMVVKPGYAEPDKVIVIGGHYDSIVYGESPGPYVFAPGSDDNGSGTATVLEVARVLADIPLRKTVIFMAFSAEEVGLVGSWFAAEEFFWSGTDIEVMFNFDMVGYTENTYWDLSVTSGQNTAYRNLTSAAASRATALIPVVGSSPGGSDHMSFDQHGYNIVNSIESDFNYPGWHTNLDLSSRMDFPYLTEVVKMATASVAIVADAAHPTHVEEVVDMGDGASLMVVWSDCHPDYTYTVFAGTALGVYTDTFAVPSGMCTYVINGLTEGETYYVLVNGTPTSGYPAAYNTGNSGTPYVVPRAPRSLSATPEYQQIALDWLDNREADFDHYQIARRLDQLDYALLANNITSSNYIDTEVLGQIDYGYKILAIDQDGYVSDYSNEADAFAATFDGGILLVDEMTTSFGIPSQELQEVYFTNLLGNSPYLLERVDTDSSVMSRSMAGRGSSIFWFDDDLVIKALNSSYDNLVWFAGFQTNLLVTGLRTLVFAGSSPLSGGDLFFDQFGVSEYQENQSSDFVGAIGQNGWPSMQAKPGGIFGGKIPNVCSLTPRPGAVVICSWDSFTDDPNYEGQPCGLLYQTANGPRVVLGFPLYFMTESSAQSFINHVKVFFGETDSLVTDGDVDGSGSVDVADLVYLVDFLFRGGISPANMNSADVDASCSVNVADVTYLVAYLFIGGPIPQPGCAEP